MRRSVSGHGLEGEHVAVDRDDGEAAARDVDRVADRWRAARAAAPRSAAAGRRVALDGGDGAELLHDAGEHARHCTRAPLGRAAWQPGPRRARPGRSSRTLVSSSSAARRASARDAERAEQRPAVAADQARGQEQRERVDEAVAQERAGELGAALDQQRGDLALARAAAAPRSSDVGLERLHARRAAAGAPARRDAQHRRRAAADRASRLPAREPAAPVEHHAQRQALGRRLGVARQQLGIVGERRAAADGDGVALARASRARAARLSGDEIQRLSPVLVAVRPSSVAASLSSTNGRPWTTCVRKRRVLAARPRLVVAAGQLDLDARPRAAARAPGRRPRGSDRRSRTRRARCRPRSARRRTAAGGRGGCTARARRRPSRRDGGSRAGVERDRARRAARPRRSCQPSPSTRPSRAITQPTMGFGLALRRPRSASSSARSSSSASRSFTRRRAPRAPSRPRRATAAS